MHVVIVRISSTLLTHLLFTKEVLTVIRILLQIIPFVSIPVDAIDFPSKHHPFLSTPVDAIDFASKHHLSYISSNVDYPKSYYVGTLFHR